MKRSILMLARRLGRELLSSGAAGIGLVLLLCATPARAEYIPGPCTGGPAGVICSPGEWTQPGYVSESSPNPYLDIQEHEDEFEGGATSNELPLTIWFRSDTPGTPDVAFQYSVGAWRTVHNGLITPPIAQGHVYTAWATIERESGEQTLIAIQADGEGNDSTAWNPTTRVTVDSPNQVGGPTDTLCITAAEPSQESVTLGCGEGHTG